MMTISLTTIIAGAVVVLLAILGSLINPFLRSLRFPDNAENEENPAEEETDPTAETTAKEEEESLESREPISVIITAHDNLYELEHNLQMFLQQKYPADYPVIVGCQSTDGETQDYLKRMATENSHLYYTYIPESSR